MGTRGASTKSPGISFIFSLKKKISLKASSRSFPGTLPVSGGWVVWRQVAQRWKPLLHLGDFFFGYIGEIGM